MSGNIRDNHGTGVPEWTSAGFYIYTGVTGAGVKDSCSNRIRIREQR